MILRPHRRHMKSENFEKTIMLQSNYYRDESTDPINIQHDN